MAFPVNEDLEQSLKRLVLDPLGMNETSFFLDQSNAERLMPMHGTNNFNELISLNQKDLVVVDIEKTHPSKGLNIHERGGGGLFSTVKDYQLFCKFLLDRKARPGSGFLHHRAFWSDLGALPGLAALRRWTGTVARGLRALQPGAVRRRQYRRADGRLVYARDQLYRRPQGTEDAHSRSGR